MSVIVIIILLISICLASSFGSAPIAVDDVLYVIKYGLLQEKTTLSEHLLMAFDIVWLLRLPRIILAVCVGGGLAVCGTVMQAIVKNPLADPYILGVSSGASLGAASAIMLGLGNAFGENFLGASAFIGAFTASVLVLLLAKMGGKATSIKLILSGTALNAVFSAFSSFIIYFSNDIDRIQTIIYWLMGSLSGAKWNSIVIIFPLTVIVIAFFCCHSRVLNLMLLGEETALTLGYNLYPYRILFLLLISLLIGVSVYAAGIIGFVGLIVPHITRMIFGADHKMLVPYSALVGAIFLLWSDVLCRCIIPKTEVPIGILISLLGAPTFVYLMIKKSYAFGGE